VNKFLLLWWGWNLGPWACNPAL